MTGFITYPTAQTMGFCVAWMVPRSCDRAKVVKLLLVEGEWVWSSNVPLCSNNPWGTESSAIMYVTLPLALAPWITKDKWQIADCTTATYVLHAVVQYLTGKVVGILTIKFDFIIGDILISVHKRK